MEVHVEIDGTAKVLNKRHRPRMRLLAVDTVFDRLVDVMLTNRGAHDRMDRRGQALRGGHPVAQGDGH